MCLPVSRGIAGFRSGGPAPACFDASFSRNPLGAPVQQSLDYCGFQYPHLQSQAHALEVIQYYCTRPGLLGTPHDLTTAVAVCAGIPAQVHTLNNLLIHITYLSTPAHNAFPRAFPQDLWLDLRDCKLKCSARSHNHCRRPLQSFWWPQDSSARVAVVKHPR